MMLFDPSLVEMGDLSAQFYLGTEDLGQRRDMTCCRKLAQLNEYVPVRVLEGVDSIEALPDNELARFQVVVMCDQPLATQVALNARTHAKNIAFVAASVCGLFASAFCDFGTNFIVSDPTGEPPLVGLISSITHDTEGIVTCVEDTRHGLEEGDHVIFREVRGMEELNGGLPRRVKVLSPYSFAIGDTSMLVGEYSGGGVFEEVKQPKVLVFRPLGESLASPECVISDFAKIDRQAYIHVGFQALARFQALHGRPPFPRNEADASELISIACEIGPQAGDGEIDPQAGDGKKILRAMAFGAAGYLAPLSTFIGGLVAQEVLKACSGKFHPIFQHIYFDALECLPVADAQTTAEDCASTGSRYDAQIAVFGQAFQRRLADLRGFIVGAGAIGCELLKVFALMGVGSGSNGQLHVTDMDIIEKSNLNRQFLFRSWDVSKPKSRTAVEAITTINPDTRDKLLARMDRVGPETEHIFDDAFYNALDFVANALDNLEARRYVDRRCVFYRKPLLESGTLSTKGNTQVVVPHLTESYSSSQDPPEKTIPFCTLHNFPNNLEHTIQWAMDQFHGLFRTDPENANLYLTQPRADFIDSLMQPGQGQKERLERLLRCLVVERPLSFEACVTWARLRFEEFFSNNIKQLLFNFPRDALTSTGAPFWSGPKRAPSPLQFDPENVRLVLDEARGYL